MYLIAFSIPHVSIRFRNLYLFSMYLIRPLWIRRKKMPPILRRLLPTYASPYMGAGASACCAVVSKKGASGLMPTTSKVPCGRAFEGGIIKEGATMLPGVDAPPACVCALAAPAAARVWSGKAVCSVCAVGCMPCGEAFAYTVWASGGGLTYSMATTSKVPGGRVFEGVGSPWLDFSTAVYLVDA